MAKRRGNGENGYPEIYDNEDVPRVKKAVRRKRRRSPVKILMIVLFVVIALYLLKYTVDFISSGPNLAVETVDYGSIDIPNAFDGIVIRDEKVVKTAKGGEPSFIYAEGDRVRKNALVCTVRENDTALKAAENLQNIDESIIEEQKNRADLSKYKDEISRIEGNIASAVSSAQTGIATQNFNSVYKMRNSLETQMSLRTNIWLNENSEGSDSLASQRRNYQMQLNNSIEKIYSDCSGIITLSYDGYEDVFTPEKLSEIDEKAVREKYDINYLSKVVAVEGNSPIFKIINSNNWYIASYIDNDIAAEWKVGDVKTIRAVLDKRETSVEMTIHSLESGDAKTYVVFESDRSLEDFMSVRNIEFYITDSSYVGLKVPNTALTERTYLKIPNSCVMDRENNPSVIKRANGRDYMVKIKIDSYDENYSYVKQDFDDLKIGDVLVNGTGEDAGEYTLSDIYTKTGVYIANGAFTEFVGVTVLGSNSQYSIVDAGSTLLKPYYRIITNAAETSDGQEIK